MNRGRFFPPRPGQTIALEVIVRVVKIINLTAFPLDVLRYRVSPPSPHAARPAKTPAGTAGRAMKP